MVTEAGCSHGPESAGPSLAGVLLTQVDAPSSEGRNEESHHTSEDVVGDAAYAAMDEGAMNREELQRAHLASRRQPTVSHPAIVQRDRIAASGNPGRHAADDEVLALDDEDQGRSPFDSPSGP